MSLTIGERNIWNWEQPAILDYMYAIGVSQQHTQKNESRAGLKKKKRQWVDPVREQKGIYSKYVHLPLEAYTAAVLYYAWLWFII